MVQRRLRLETSGWSTPIGTPVANIARTRGRFVDYGRTSPFGDVQPLCVVVETSRWNRTWPTLRALKDNPEPRLHHRSPVSVWSARVIAGGSWRHANCWRTA